MGRILKVRFEIGFRVLVLEGFQLDRFKTGFSGVGLNAYSGGRFRVFWGRFVVGCDSGRFVKNFKGKVFMNRFQEERFGKDFKG